MSENESGADVDADVVLRHDKAKDISRKDEVVSRHHIEFVHEAEAIFIESENDELAADHALSVGKLTEAKAAERETWTKRFVTTHSKTRMSEEKKKEETHKEEGATESSKLTMFVSAAHSVAKTVKMAENVQFISSTLPAMSVWSNVRKKVHAVVEDFAREGDFYELETKVDEIRKELDEVEAHTGVDMSVFRKQVEELKKRIQVHMETTAALERHLEVANEALWLSMNSETGDEVDTHIAQVRKYSAKLAEKRKPLLKNLKFLKVLIHEDLDTAYRNAAALNRVNENDTDDESEDDDSEDKAAEELLLERVPNEDIADLLQTLDSAGVDDQKSHKAHAHCRNALLRWGFHEIDQPRMLKAMISMAWNRKINLRVMQKAVRCFKKVERLEEKIAPGKTSGPRREEDALQREDKTKMRATVIQHRGIANGIAFGSSGHRELDRPLKGATGEQTTRPLWGSSRMSSGPGGVERPVALQSGVGDALTKLGLVPEPGSNRQGSFSARARHDSSLALQRHIHKNADAIADRRFGSHSLFVREEAFTAAAKELQQIAQASGAKGIPAEKISLPASLGRPEKPKAVLPQSARGPPKAARPRKDLGQEASRRLAPDHKGGRRIAAGQTSTCAHEDVHTLSTTEDEQADSQYTLDVLLNLLRDVDKGLRGDSGESIFLEDEDVTTERTFLFALEAAQSGRETVAEKTAALRKFWTGAGWNRLQEETLAQLLRGALTECGRVTCLRVFEVANSKRPQHVGYASFEKSTELGAAMARQHQVGGMRLIMVKPETNIVQVEEDGQTETTWKAADWATLLKKQLKKVDGPIPSPLAPDMTLPSTAQEEEVGGMRPSPPARYMTPPSTARKEADASVKRAADLEAKLAAREREVEATGVVEEAEEPPDERLRAKLLDVFSRPGALKETSMELLASPEQEEPGSGVTASLPDAMDALGVALAELHTLVKSTWGSVTKAGQILAYSGGDVGGGGRWAVSTLHKELVKRQQYGRSSAELVVLLQALGLPASEEATFSPWELDRLAEPDLWYDRSGPRAHKAGELLGALQLRRILLASMSGLEVALARIHIGINQYIDPERSIVSCVKPLEAIAKTLNGAQSKVLADALVTAHGIRVLVGLVVAPDLALELRLTGLLILSRAIAERGGQAFAEHALGHPQKNLKLTASTLCREDMDEQEKHTQREMAKNKSQLDDLLVKHLWWPILDALDEDNAKPGPIRDGPFLRQLLALLLQARVWRIAVSGDGAAALAEQLATALMRLQDGEVHQALRSIEYLEQSCGDREVMEAPGTQQPEDSRHGHGVCTLAAAFLGCRILQERIEMMPVDHTRQVAERVYKKWVRQKERLLARLPRPLRQTAEHAKLVAFAKAVAASEDEGFETAWPPLRYLETQTVKATAKPGAPSTSMSPQSPRDGGAYGSGIEQVLMMRLHARETRFEAIKAAKRRALGASPHKKKRIIVEDAEGDTAAVGPTPYGEGARLPNLPTSTEKTWVIGSARQAIVLISVTDSTVQLAHKRKGGQSVKLPAIGA